ncbi:MAG: ATP-binding cassette domain-containing protein [Desulfovibrio sp.]|nr:ATP-binding cassette domain-containing protein [Desulfovibrio sp.]
MEKLSDFPSDLLAKLSDVSFAYPQKAPILLNADLSIRQGGHILILGANGSGKTSLLRLIRGDLIPLAGRIFWRDGENFSPSRIVARKITAIVAPFQDQKCARSPLTVIDILARGLPDEYSDYEMSGEKASKLLDSFSATDM